MGEEKPKSEGVWPTAKPFVNGGAAGMLATCAIQPIDMIKVRMQLGQGSAAQCHSCAGAICWIAKASYIYNGTAWIFQVTASVPESSVQQNQHIHCFIENVKHLKFSRYNGCVIVNFSIIQGIYVLRILTRKASAANDGKPIPLYQKALCGLTAGAIGASVGTPADLALIRMQADATLPPAQRRCYKNAFHALYRIVVDEGILALWKGAGPTVVRAMALNMGMLASYDQSVEYLKDSLSLDEASTVV
ncbi:hypothetical protein RJ639_004643, partial [Escallonia herrerae]